MNVVEGIELKPCRSHGECLGFLCSIQSRFPFELCRGSVPDMILLNDVV